MGDLVLPNRSPTELALGERLSSDELLARLVSRGSARAFAVLYQRHHQALYRYCRSIVHDEDDAQDALQSAMMRALAALQARERDLAVRPWLFRIAHNEAVSLLRRRGPTSSLGVEDDPRGLSMERTLEQREQLALLVADLQCLAERQRAALVMRELSGLSIREIAAALGVSQGAAKQSIFEARSALQEFREGRSMECEAVRRLISDGDGRTLRARRIRAHVRGCSPCRDFERMIGARTSDLRVLAPPLPAVASLAMLSRLLAHGGTAQTGGVASISAATVGKQAALSLTAKALAGVALVTAATAGTVHLTSGPERHTKTHPTVHTAPAHAAHPGPVLAKPHHEPVATKTRPHARTQGAPRNDPRAAPHEHPAVGHGSETGHHGSVAPERKPSSKIGVETPRSHRTTPGPHPSRARHVARGTNPATGHSGSTPPKTGEHSLAHAGAGSRSSSGPAAAGPPPKTASAR